LTHKLIVDGQLSVSDMVSYIQQLRLLLTYMTGERNPIAVY